MTRAVAIVGAGVSGLTTGIILAEQGWRAAIFAERIGPETTSGAAAAVWYPYDAGPSDRTIQWALETYRTLQTLADQPGTGVSIIETRQFSRTGDVEIPGWSRSLGAERLKSEIPAAFKSGFKLKVPLMGTDIYLEYLEQRFRDAGGVIHLGKRLSKLEEIDSAFELVVNCAGIGARTLVPDADLEPHRGQVAIVPKIDLPGAIASDDFPLMYAIPRTTDCIFGGTNVVTDDCAIDPVATVRMVEECSRVLGINKPVVLRERVGLRPFRRSGMRVERDQLRDGRCLIHNYGHGGAGFTLSWGCAEEVARICRANVSN